MIAALQRRGVQTTAAVAAYTALTVVMTWPIAAGLSRDVPADLGDSLLNMWILAWVAEGVLAIAGGQMTFADLWNANIFHPTPLSLTFSEHLVPQALQGLPLYLATGNVVLAYNVAFLATFALSGLGTFLLVRELTGSARAGFVAGLFYAFLPYRLGQFPHIQTISSQWMPFALFGLRRWFDTGRWTGLAGGTLAFVVQGLSSGYYLFYFAPVFGAYALWEVVARRRLRDLRTWLGLAGAGAAALALTLPFLLPYQEARDRLGFTRPFGEVIGFSADLYAYAHTPPQVHVWGSILNRFPQPEGDLFPGALPLLAALAAALVWVIATGRAVHQVTADAPARERRLARLLLAAAAAGVVVAGGVAVTGGFVWDPGGVPIRVTNVRRTLTYVAVAALAALAVSPRLRAAWRTRSTDLTPFLIAGIVFAVVMSLGPVPRAGGERLVGMNLYEAFYTYVPGFAGLRAPARFGMVASLLLAVLGGYALARLGRAARVGTAALALVGVAFLVEAYAVPMPVNLTWTSSARYLPPWPAVFRLNDGPLAYRYLVAMPADTTVIELPFGDQAWDLRYVYYAGLHGKRIVNGYSGYFPDGYRARAARLAGLWSDRDAAWQAVTSSGATHLLIHGGAYAEIERDAVIGWARLAGAEPVAWFMDGDVLLTLPTR
ncbi:MAG: hypothetical protein AB7U83_08875 [Vicinamibacterales bacterium]